MVSLLIKKHDFAVFLTKTHHLKTLYIMTFGMQGKDIRQYLGDINSSAMSRIFKRLRLQGIIERVKGTYKYFPTAYGKEVIAAGLTIRNLVLIPALA